MAGTSRYSSLHEEGADAAESNNCKLEEDYFWSLWKRKRDEKRNETRKEKRRAEQDYCWDLWKEKRKEKRNEKCLPQTCAKKVLYRARLQSWEGHVKVNAIFRDLSTSIPIAGRVTWRKSGDVTVVIEIGFRFLHAVCSQPAVTLEEAYHIYTSALRIYWL
jgi:hypothetical protein